MNLLGKATRCNLRKLLGECCLMRVIVVSTRYVHELSGLSSYYFGYFRMSVSQSSHRNAGIEIQECVAVNIFENCPVTPLHNQRITSGVAGRYVFCVAIQHLLSLWARKFRFYFRQCASVNCLHKPSTNL